ncbi:hypothetical protein [Dehalobacter restrictus]
MTNRQTFHLDLKIPEHSDASHFFGFKKHDSYCYYSSFSQGVGHA